MSTIFLSVLAHQLQDTLSDIIDDDSDGVVADMIMPKFMKEERMTGAIEDVLEMGGPALAQEVGEGEEMPTDTIREGTFTRYVAREFGLQLKVTKVAMDDGKYPEAIRAASRLKMSAYQTVDIDCALMLSRMFDTSYVGGDGLPLISASHTLPGGGTYSNLMATPMTPSVAALAVARTQIRKYPGHNGITYGYMPQKIVFPVEQQDTWEEVVGSKMRPDAGNFAAINVVNQVMKITLDDLVPHPHWNTTETNWLVLTSCKEGRLKFKWREKPRSTSWLDNSHRVMSYAISYRSARGWDDGRGVLGVNA